MNYRPASNRSRTRPLKFLVLGAVVLLILGSINRMKPESVNNGVFRVVAPIWKAEKGLGSALNSILSYFQSKNELARHNAELKEINSILSRKIISLQKLESENDELKQLFKRDKNLDAVLGVVLSGPPFSPYDTLILDVGSDEGIRAGDLVAVAGGTVIGDITEVYKTHSKATLFSSPSRETEIQIGQKKIAALAKGVGGGAFEVILPTEIKIEKNEPVYIPHIGSLTYGNVSSINATEVDFLQLISFRSPVNVFEIRYVAIIPGSKNAPNSTD